MNSVLCVMKYSYIYHCKRSKVGILNQNLIPYYFSIQIWAFFTCQRSGCIAGEDFLYSLNISDNMKRKQNKLNKCVRFDLSILQSSHIYCSASVL